MSLSTQATPSSESAPPDNPANKWNDFAAKEFREHKTRTFRTRHINEPPSPQTAPQTAPPTAPPTAPQSPTASSPDSAHSWQTFAAQESKSPQLETLPRRASSTISHAMPRKSVSENARTVQTTFSIAIRQPQQQQQRKPYLPDPPVCFCKHEAHLRTINNRVYYECHYYEEAGKRRDGSICGFHVHKEAWDRIRQQLRDNKPVDKLDTTCPAFNLTVSVVVRVNNTSMQQKWMPEMPRCFCNKPVAIHCYAFKYSQRLYFSCPDLTTLDAPLRCGYFIYAEDARFKVPEIPLHSALSPPSSSLSTSSYSSASSDHPKTECRPASAVSSPAVPSSAVSSPVVAPSAVPSINEDASIYNPPKPAIYIPQRPRIEDDHRPNFIQLLQGAKPPAWYIPTGEEEPVQHSVSALIPRSVLSYQALRNKKLDQERAKEKQINEEKLEQLKQQVEELEQTVEQLQAENDEQRKLNSDKQQEIETLLAEQEHQSTSHQELLDRAQKLAKEKDDLKNTMDLAQAELDEEIRLRQKSQQRYVQLELIVRDLLEAQDKLTKEVHDKEEKLNLKDLKCRVCFQENIEFALVPCYHCSYCKTCAEKLSECAICRTTKFAVQKVYMA